MTANDPHPPPGPLAGLRVFDMTRVLAGPAATQALGDMGAEVIKIEKPGAGDDTRAWGPPFLKDAQGADTTESAYYLSANRNKKSLALDFTKPAGLAIAKRLVATCDVLVENFRPGTLEKYGLGYAQLREEFPRLVYCSITGFGHTGPDSGRAGYDFMIQGMGGIMSLTGPPEGPPCKTGVAIADLMAGMYALAGILAALHHRDRTGEGQFVDIALFDTQLAWLSNAGQYYLTSGEVTPRMGNAHPMIVPYETFEAADGHVILAVGNDAQFRRFCDFAGRPDLAADPRYAANSARVRNRDSLLPVIRALIAARPAAHWLEGLEKLGVPCGPVNDVAQAFASPQAAARGMVGTARHPLSPDPVRLIASPLKFSRTPASCRRAPPVLGQDSEDVLKNDLGLRDGEISALRRDGVI